jgi:hypothetical protein
MYSDRNKSICYFAHHKFHTTTLRSKTGLRSDGQSPKGLSHGKRFEVYYDDNYRCFKDWSCKFRISSLETRHKRSTSKYALCIRNQSRLAVESFTLYVKPTVGVL